MIKVKDLVGGGGCLDYPGGSDLTPSTQRNKKEAEMKMQVRQMRWKEKETWGREGTDSLLALKTLGWDTVQPAGSICSRADGGQ